MGKIAWPGDNLPGASDELWATRIWVDNAEIDEEGCGLPLPDATIPSNSD
jgi:hypothetical protein